MTLPARSPRSTERLTLEPLARTRAGHLWAAAEASLVELRPWMAWAAKTSLEETKTFAANAEAQWAGGTVFHFVIVKDGEVIGSVGLEVKREELDRLGVLGYWVRSDQCGCGYATEASSSVVDFAFRELGLHRIELRAGVGNVASQRVAEKLGFRREGTLRQGSRGAESAYDCYLYGLLASDPRPSRAGREG
jgi:ribosomal-protein-serine acetyltransferase